MLPLVGSGNLSRAAAGRIVMIALLVVSALALTRAATAAELPANLVTNPSLEEKLPANGLPPGWGTFFAKPTGAYLATIVDAGRTGKKQIRIDHVPEKGEGAFGVMPANRVPLDPKKRYVARGWVKVTGGKRATADVKLHYYDAGGAYLGQTRVGFASPGSDEWQLVTVTDHASEFPLAKNIGLAFACTGDAQAQYDDLELLAFDKDKLPANFDETYGITLSPQLAVLARRVGAWDTKTKIKPCKWVPDGAETTAIETIGWTLGGQFLEARQANLESGIAQLSLTTYDARDQVYRSWFFGSNANLPRGQSAGQWDKATETLTFKDEVTGEFTSVVRLKFIGNDAVEWQGIWKDKDGAVLMDLEGTSKRRPGDTAAHLPMTPVDAVTPLDGTWITKSITISGEAAPAEVVKKSWFKFNGAAVTFKIDAQEVKGTFVVDSRKDPAWIDVIVDKAPGVPDAQALGIYDLSGDKLQICLLTKRENDDSRATDFTSAEKSLRLLVVLEKKK
jgi:uncharacterized protein (TIGR03067 family)